MRPAWGLIPSTACVLLCCPTLFTLALSFKNPVLES